jgi:hypothetical protein
MSKRLEADYCNILVAIFELMLRGGVPPSELLPLCMRSLERAERKYRVNRKDEGSGLVTAALVLDAWHRNRRYLTSRGTPKALRLFGRAPSVEGLVRLQKVKKGAPGVARHLKSVGLLVRCGKDLYKPASDAAVVSARDPFVLQYTARALSTLLETVAQNVNHTRNLAPLIERCAEVPDLPRKHVKEFQTFTHAQGRTFVRTVNDWLESRRIRGSSGRATRSTVRAGIHTYAYVAIRRSRGGVPATSSPRSLKVRLATPSLGSSPHCSWVVRS